MKRVVGVGPSASRRLLRNLYSVGVWELIFYLLSCMFGMFVMLIGSMLQVMWTVWLLVYLSAFVTNRRAVFWAVCSLYLAGKVRELRGTVEYVKAMRMVVLYSLSLLCWLRPKNFFSFEKRCSATILWPELTNLIPGLRLFLCGCRKCC